MMISLLVLMVPIIIIVWFFQTTPEEDVERIDYQPALAKAQEEADFPILHPTDVPETWIPVRVAWATEGERWIDGEPAPADSWQLGYMVDNIYIGLQQREPATESFVRSITREGTRQDEDITIGDRTWEHWVSEDDRTQSLVWRDGDMVALVTGDTDEQWLTAFAGTLTDQ